MGRRTLDSLVRAHGDATMRVIVDVLGPGPDADDAWQDVWLSISAAKVRLRREISAWPFIRTTAIRKAIDRLRARREGPGGLADEPAAPCRERACGLELDRLPGRERLCLVLYFWQGMSVAEIAEVIGRPAGTIKTWMHRGRERLRRALLDRKETP